LSRLSGIAVTVTGAGGFIGSHLVEALVAEGARVRGMVRYTSRGDRGALDLLADDVASEVELVLGDIRDPESVADGVRGCEVVFHLAAQIAIPYSYVNPRDFFETNVLGTLNVAQACRAAGTRRLIHTSTSEVYGTPTEVPITESHPLSGQSPYAASKIGADQLVLSFHRSFELPATVLRPFNTYGPRQSPRAVIPTILAQALKGEVVRLGSLEPRRDLTYVADCVRGFIAAAESEGAVGRTLQLGTGEDVSIAELVEEVGSLVERELRVEQEEERIRPKASEVMRLVSNPEQMAETTGWRPQTSLRDGLAETARWIESHLDAYAADQYVI
jgi:NAD dependent epimerase/dehydratase